MVGMVYGKDSFKLGVKECMGEWWMIRVVESIEENIV